MAIVKFYRGLETNYNSVTHADGIYFCTDSYKIMMNGDAYGGGENSSIGSDKTVQDVSLDGTTLTVTYTDNTTEDIELSALGGVYTSGISDDSLEMPNTVGGISSGTTVADLNGMTISAILDDLLFPTVYPTFTAPSASIAFSSYSSTQEVGVAGPTSSNFTTSFNAGAITLNGVKQNDRAGSLIAESSFIYVNGDASNTTLPETVSEGSTTFRYRAAYEAGPQPVDNKGNNYGEPLAAGTVDSSTITLNGTYPWYATTVTAGTLTKQSLIAWNATAGNMTSPQFVLQAHTSAAPQMFMLPRELSELQMLNTVSNSMEVISSSDWTVSTSNEDVNGVTHTYYTYTYTGADRGSVTLIVKF